MVLAIGVILAVVLPITTFRSRPASAGTFAVPLVPLALVVNECKWMVQAWRNDGCDVPIIKDRNGLRVLVLVFVTCGTVSGIRSVIQMSAHICQPPYLRPSAPELSYFATGVLAVGVVASLLLM